MKRLIKFKTTALLFIPLVLACFALLPRAQAENPLLLPAPPPDGGYAGFNTAEGFQALINVNTAIGIFNTAIGAKTLSADTSGAHNTAVGGQALLHNLDGSFNTAIGENALVFNVHGSMNMALGQGALANNTASANTAMGFQALNRNTIGANNTATGWRALFSNTTGGGNTAVGVNALSSNTGPTSFNTAIGYQALVNNATGSDNVALGRDAGINHSTGNDNIYIRNDGLASEVGTIRIGTQIVHSRTFIAGISGVNEGGTGISTVYINSAGQLGTTPPPSSRRFKKEIKSMDNASEAVLALKPVTFRYKEDAKDTPQFGLIAEEVADVNPDLIIRDPDGKPYTVRYEAVNAMLLNEFLKEHKKVEELQGTVAALAKTVKEQAAQIQKVSAQLEMGKPAPSVVANQ
jgi:Chaperone of endosialidase